MREVSIGRALTFNRSDMAGYDQLIEPTGRIWPVSWTVLHHYGVWSRSWSLPENASGFLAKRGNAIILPLSKSGPIRFDPDGP